jgi:hypothetical protein
MRKKRRTSNEQPRKRQLPRLHSPESSSSAVSGRGSRRSNSCCVRGFCLFLLLRRCRQDIRRKAVPPRGDCLALFLACHAISAFFGLLSRRLQQPGAPSLHLSPVCGACFFSFVRLCSLCAPTSVPPPVGPLCHGWVPRMPLWAALLCRDGCGCGMRILLLSAPCDAQRVCVDAEGGRGGG